MSHTQFPITNDYLANMLKNRLFKRLTESSIEYIADTALGEAIAVVEFAGEFEGQPVVWKATVTALNADQNAARNFQAAQAAVQYIDVSTEQHAENDVLPVEIGLFVSQIDEPTVFKVIMMVRQYKNLRRGRHEFSGLRK